MKKRKSRVAKQVAQQGQLIFGIPHTTSLLRYFYLGRYLTMGNIPTAFKVKNKPISTPPPEQVLIGPQLEAMCDLFVAHQDLRIIFSQFFVDGDWIATLLEQIPNEVSRGDDKHHISYLLPSGGFLYVTDDRTNLYKSRRAMKASIQKQISLSRSLSSTSLTMSQSTSSRNGRRLPQSPLVLQSSLLVLASAIRLFAVSSEMMIWRRQQEESASRSNSKLSTTRSGFFPRLSVRRSTTVVPVMDDSSHHESEHVSSMVHRKSSRFREVMRSDHYDTAVSSRIPGPPPVSPIGPLSRSSSALLSSPASSVASGNDCGHGPSATMTTCTHENVRLVLLEGIRSFCPPVPRERALSLTNEAQLHSLSLSAPSQRNLLSRGSSDMLHRQLSKQLSKGLSQHSLGRSSSKSDLSDISRSASGYFSPQATETEISKLLSSKKWLKDLVEYLSQELPFAMTITEPPQMTGEVDAADNLSLFSHSLVDLISGGDPATMNSNTPSVVGAGDAGDAAAMGGKRATFYQQNEAAPSFPHIFVNRAFQTMTQYSDKELCGKSIQVVTHESCTEVNQLSKLYEAQHDCHMVKLALTIMRKDESLCYDLLAVKPVVSAQGEYVASVAVHYPLSGNEERFPEDLQAADVLLNLMALLLA